MTAATPVEVDAATAAALRAEHDALAARLEVRTSIDDLRKALYTVFVGLIGAGTSVKLAWDRWGPLKPGVVRKVAGARPLFLLVAVTLTVVLLLVAIGWLLRARRLAREEDALFARFRQLRATLGLDR
jgi:hypothetical protein